MKIGKEFGVTDDDIEALMAETEGKPSKLEPLAKVILREDWTPGLEALEIGCGLGLPGIAALAKGLRVIFTDYDATALHSAAWNGDLRMAKLLVEAGADITARDPEHDNTPAGWAEVAINITNNPDCKDVADYLAGLAEPTP